MDQKVVMNQVLHQYIQQKINIALKNIHLSIVEAHLAESRVVQEPPSQIDKGTIWLWSNLTGH